MRVPLSWLRDHVELPPHVTGQDIADRLIRVGLEVESVEVVGADIRGPIVIGEVAEITELAGFAKPIRYCRVRTGRGADSGIVCGARNFRVGDRVVVALPEAVLPGGFAITERVTYGRASEGMMCSERELGIGGDHEGIAILSAGDVAHQEIGADAVTLLGLRDEVLDVAVTPDRGYCLSVRGIARELAHSYGVAFSDPALGHDAVLNRETPLGEVAVPAPRKIHREDPVGCDQIVVRLVRGVDASRLSPLWLRRRLSLVGMRSLSLVVDVTNYVMMELGQPLHAFNESAFGGDIVVRQARRGERLTTLDHVTRDLSPDDMVIVDSARDQPVALAGIMGGLDSEIGDDTTDLMLEAAHFTPSVIAGMSRRHRLSSEASRRFERGVDPTLPREASARAVALLRDLGTGDYAGCVEAGESIAVANRGKGFRYSVDDPTRVGGFPIDRTVVIRSLEAVGCVLPLPDDGVAVVEVTPPPWRPDLLAPADLTEEVLRLVGYDQIPSKLPKAPAGRGLTQAQRLRRHISRALAGAGYVEVLTYPFVGPGDWDSLGFASDDARRRALSVANPLADTEPLLRTTLLPRLLSVAQRNVSRGQLDVAVAETGVVFRPSKSGTSSAVPRPSVTSRPSDAEVMALTAALPEQPLHIAVVLAGNRLPSGWWGAGRPAVWGDAIAAARTVAAAVGVELRVRAADMPPWHPGRCAALLLGDVVVGYAGELHPRVVAQWGLPARACAMELATDAIVAAAVPAIRAPRVSTFPVATQDVALLVPETVPVAEVDRALRDGAGPLLESLWLFDIYTGEQVIGGSRSLAFTLRFRAPDRTLTVAETTTARDSAVAEASRRLAAVPRR
jgi:phenylalanyl-tRNA synthetase beta chain